METLNKVLVGALQHCDTKEVVEDTFIRFNLSDSAEKTACLIEAMGAPDIFLSGGGSDCNSRYATVLAMFLTGEWKMNRLYERMGL